MLAALLTDPTDADMAPARPSAFTDDSRNGVTKEHERAKRFYRSKNGRLAMSFSAPPQPICFSI
jgi:hypothetical protein